MFMFQVSEQLIERINASTFDEKIIGSFMNSICCGECDGTCRSSCSGGCTLSCGNTCQGNCDTNCAFGGYKS